MHDQRSGMLRAAAMLKRLAADLLFLAAFATSTHASPATAEARGKPPPPAVRSQDELRAAAQAMGAGDCGDLEKIRASPPKAGVLGVDPYWDRIFVHGQHYRACLFAAIADRRPVHGITFAPGIPARTIGDLAHALLVDIGFIEWGLCFPAEVANSPRGAIAFHEWLDQPGNRTTWEACMLPASSKREGAAIPESAHLSWQLDHSSHVVRARLVDSEPVVFDGARCGLFWKFEVLDPFKGELAPGSIVEVWGPDEPGYWRKGGERLLFLRQYDEYASSDYDACNRHVFTTYLQVHWSCCEVRGSGEGAEILFESMIDAEVRGADVPVPASVVYRALREVGGADR